MVSCHDYAWETVRGLAEVEGVTVVGFLQGEMPNQGLTVRLRRFWRAQGPRMGQAAVSSSVQKLWRVVGRALWSSSNPVPGVCHLHVDSLDSPEVRSALEPLRPDLLVVDGSNILKPDFFTTPRHGAINLHCGKLPDYRGMPPAFWELYHGDREVGVSVHEVSAKLDAGAVFATATVPLDPVPPVAPVAYAIPLLA